MHHSAVCVNTRCLLRSVRHDRLAGRRGCDAPALTWGFTGHPYLMQR
jgi:hypothetical protein